MKSYFISFIIFFLFSACHNIELKTGDIIFQDLDCGDICDAIEKVTPGYNGEHFSHVGLIIKESKNKYFVLEAYPPQVKLTPLKDFLKRSVNKKGKPKVRLARIRQEHSHLINHAIKFGKKKLGIPYDPVFLLNNNKYYCSEFLYAIFKKANKEKPFFHLKPMTFKNPVTNNIIPTWINYYKSLSQPVPEGKLGINPGNIATDPKIKFIYGSL